MAKESTSALRTTETVVSVDVYAMIASISTVRLVYVGIKPKTCVIVVWK